MMLFNIIVTLINIFILTVSYFVFKQKFDSRYLNKTVLDNTRKELNNFMRSINDATLNNCNIIEVKVEDLKKLIEEADIKIKEIEKLLAVDFNKSTDGDGFSASANQNISPNKILAGYRKKNQTSENSLLKKEDIDKLKKEIEEMDLLGKFRFLSEKKIPISEIKKILDLPTGEFEVLLNVVNINDKD